MSLVISKTNHDFLYQQVMQLVRDLSEQGTLLPGEKLPSLRKMAEKLNVSIPTVKLAYQSLEAQGLVEAREKSGYFLKTVNTQLARPKRVKLSRAPV